MADQTDLLMITTNVILRTFWIRKGDSAGTGFTLDYDQKQYLVTARHVVDGIARSDAVDVFHNGNWKNLPVTVVGNGEDDIDICVMAAATRLSPPLTLEPSAAGMIYGQEAYFLGFPYGLSGDTDPLTNGFPLPFVKKAIVSCVFAVSKLPFFYLDGHNNPGFSGGPVVFKPQKEKNFRVAGVISGYASIHEPIYHEGQEIPLTYRYNTRLIKAFGIRNAVDLIRSNPVGLSLV